MLLRIRHVAPILCAKNGVDNSKNKNNAIHCNPGVHRTLCPWVGSRDTSAIPGLRWKGAN